MAADKAHPITSLLAGAAAGIAVDVALFPLVSASIGSQTTTRHFILQSSTLPPNAPYTSAPQFQPRHISIIRLLMHAQDTLKTRLQSSQGFFKAGGFRGIYAGLQSVAIG